MREGEQHLTAQQCQALLHGDLEPQVVVERLFHHLLALCPECQEGWQQLQAGEGAQQEATLETREELNQRLEAVFDRVRQKVGGLRKRISQEQERAGSLIQELQQLPSLPARVQRVRRSKRFRSWALCEALLTESLGLSFERPTEAAERAELAIEAAWALDDSNLGQALISDLMARGWALLGQARRRSGQLSLAAESFTMSRYFVRQGSGDPLVAAEVASFEALLRQDKRELTKALKLQSRAVHIYRQLEAWGLMVRALLQRATTQHAANDPAAALEDLQESMELLQTHAGELPQDPRLRLCAEHALIFTLQRAGQSDEARRRLAALATDEPQPADPWSRLYGCWLDGELARAKGEAARAETAALRVHGHLMEGGLFHPAASPQRSLLAVLAERSWAQKPGAPKDQAEAQKKIPSGRKKNNKTQRPVLDHHRCTDPLS